MDQKQQKNTKKYVLCAVLAIAVMLLASLPILFSDEEAETGPQASILSAQSAERSISGVLLSGGTLIAEDPVTVTIPAEVKLTEYLVKNGDLVTEGQAIATVDRVSVMAAIAQVQEAMEEIRSDMDKIANEKEPTIIKAAVGGTVKTIYANTGEDVRDVLLRDGALAVISMDGLMAVTVSCNTDLSVGDTVPVTLTDGTEAEGTVTSNLDGKLTVTIKDEGFSVGEAAVLSTVEGSAIGSGTLYINSPWNVMAYSGTVSKVRVSEGAAVSAGRRLFDLKDTSQTAEYDSLSREHRQYEELMLTLFKLYQSETVAAPQDGMITGIDGAGTYMLSFDSDAPRIRLLANAPDGSDNAAYTNYVGQVTEIGIDGLLVKINPSPISVTDYMDLSAVPTDTALMTYRTTYWASAPVYELSGGQWVQISSGSIQEGDILLFCGSEGNFVWVIRIGTAAVDTEAPSTNDPSEPVQPTEPDDATSPTTPSAPGNQGNKNSQSSGRSPSTGSSAAQKEETERYTTGTVTIASVTGQGHVTVQVTIDEMDIRKVWVGQPVILTVDALGGVTCTASVTEILSETANEGGNTKFTVLVTAERKPDMLAGMTAHVKMVLPEEAAEICIPVAALTEKGSATLVYTGYDEETGMLTDPVSVTTGLSDGEYVQILSGLNTAQRVYYPYYDTLVISNRPEQSNYGFRR